MKKTMATRAMVTGMILGAFTLGYFCASVSQQPANAQGLGNVLEQAGKAGGPLAATAQLGSSIVEMQQHVSGLQKNLDALKKVESALTGK